MDESQNPQRSQQIEVNGQLPFATGYELDGTDNQDPVIGVAVINPNLDAVSEMKVTSQNYDAEFGKAVAGLVTAQTKSGSNSFHGSAFEYRRSDAQQARDPFSQSQRKSDHRAVHPSTLHNQFGGSIGGPIMKDKVFFFARLPGTAREERDFGHFTTVPTAQARQLPGLAAAENAGSELRSERILASGQIYDPTTGDADTGIGRTASANNQIPGNAAFRPGDQSVEVVAGSEHGAAGYSATITRPRDGYRSTPTRPMCASTIRSPRSSTCSAATPIFNSSLDGESVFGAAGGSASAPTDFAGTIPARIKAWRRAETTHFRPKWLTDFRFGWFRYPLQ